METTFKIAQYTPIAYQFNPQTGYYEKSVRQPSPMPLNAMPFELRREFVRAEQIKGNATECLTKRERKKGNGSKEILTGLQPINFAHWYIGNHYSPTAKKGKLSDILFYFYPDNSKMMAFYFSGYHSNNKALRELFAARTIPHLNNYILF